MKKNKTIAVGIKNNSTILKEIKKELNIMG